MIRHLFDFLRFLRPFHDCRGAGASMNLLRHLGGRPKTQPLEWLRCPHCGTLVRGSHSCEPQPAPCPTNVRKMPVRLSPIRKLKGRERCKKSS